MPKKCKKRAHRGRPKMKTLPPPADNIMESQDNTNNVSELVQETPDDGTSKHLYTKKKIQIITNDDSPGIEYPEIIFYLISRYIDPEDIGNFALINKTAHAVTNNKSFWTLQFKRHCEGNPLLANVLKHDSCKHYGLRQTVIRSLFQTYNKFIKRVSGKSSITPHSLISRVCVNSWFAKGSDYWKVFFKLKRRQLRPAAKYNDFIEELERVDANPEEGNQMLVVTCKSFCEMPALMGMTLTSVKMQLLPNFFGERLHLGFNASHYAAKGVVTDHDVVLHGVLKVVVHDWWHPEYPQTSNIILQKDPPLFRYDFFDDDFP